MSLSAIYAPKDAPRLSLVELQVHDPTARFSATGETRTLCPLPPCIGTHTNLSRHRSLSVRNETGVWHCHRCQAGGLLVEFHSAHDDSPVRDWNKAGQIRHKARLQARLGVASSMRQRVALDSPTMPEAVSVGVDRGQGGAVSESASGLTWRDRIGPLREIAGSKGAEYLARRGVDGARLAGEGVRVAFAPTFGQIPGVRRGRAAVVFFLDAGRAAGAGMGALSGNGESWVADGAVAVHGRFLDIGGGSTTKAQTFGKKTGVFYAGAGLFGQTVICEAPIDALSLLTCGVPSVALCGTTGGDAVLKRSCALARAVAAFDADSAGDAGAVRLAQTLRPVGATVWRLTPPPPCKDWNDALFRLGQARLTLWLFDELDWTGRVAAPSPAGVLLNYREARARLTWRHAVAEAAELGGNL